MRRCKSFRSSQTRSCLVISVGAAWVAGSVAFVGGYLLSGAGVLDILLAGRSFKVGVRLRVSSLRGMADWVGYRVTWYDRALLVTDIVAGH